MPIGKYLNTNLGIILAPLRRYILFIWLISIFYNILALAPIIYLRAVFGTAVPNRSSETLIMLTIIVVFLIICYGILGTVRSQIAERAGAKIYKLLYDKIFEISYRRSVYAPSQEQSAQALSDLQGLKDFMSSSALIALFDVLFTPLFIIALYVFHPLLGLMGLLTLTIMLIINWLSERLTASRIRAAQAANRNATSYARRSLGSAEVVEAMGISNRIKSRWKKKSDRGLALEVEAGEKSTLLVTFSTAFATMQRSLTLAVGAYLAIQREITPGAVFAGIILLSRAVAPVYALISGWKTIVTARAQYERLTDVFENLPSTKGRTRLPPHAGKISFEHVIIAPPGHKTPILKDVNFSINPGVQLGVLGECGAGKSTLARAALGLWPCQKGVVRLDGADIFRSDRSVLGDQIGYLPQNVELLEGSIAENIARMGDKNDQKIIEAAKFAEVHELILQLPHGYDTQVGSQNLKLSEGYRQRIAFARALYNVPTFIVLDEPSTNLDEAGEAALFKALKRLKANGVTLIVISHSRKILGEMDMLLMLDKGQIKEFGNTSKVLENKPGSYHV